MFIFQVSDTLLSPFFFFLIGSAAASILVCCCALAIVRWTHRASLPFHHFILLIAVATTLVGPLAAAYVSWIGIAPISVVAKTSANTSIALIPQPSITDRDLSPSSRGINLQQRAIPGDDSAVRSRSEQASVTESQQFDPTGLAADSSATASSLPRAASWKHIDWFALALPAIWLAGSVFQWIVLCRGWRLLRQFSASLTPITDRRLQQVAESAAAALGITKIPRLYQSEATDIPLSLGLLRPRVVLPSALLDSWSPEMWRPLLLHELAHIHRHDHIVGLLQRLVGVLYWWNPLVRRASAQLSSVREQICDDVVTRHETDRRRYPSLLVELAELAVNWRPAESALAALGNKHSDLAHRVRRLADPGRTLITSLSRSATAAGVGFVLTAALFVFATAIDASSLLAKSEETDGATTASNNATAAKSNQATSPTSVEPKRETIFLVVDQKDQPIANATVSGQGISLTGGASVLWSDFAADKKSADPPRVTTGADGFARLPHPDLTNLPAGVVLKWLRFRIEHPEFTKHSFSVPDEFTRIATVQLKRGAEVKIAAQRDGQPVVEGRLFVQFSSDSTRSQAATFSKATGTWRLSRLSTGLKLIRVVHIADSGEISFSRVHTLKLIDNHSHDLHVSLELGQTVRGKLDDSVPRPVANGRAMALLVESSSPVEFALLHWQKHVPIATDGSFILENLPPGNLHFLAICDGFMSKTGDPPANATPQELGAWQSTGQGQSFASINADTPITVAMTPMLRCTIHVVDSSGKPISGAGLSLHGGTGPQTLCRGAYSTFGNLLSPKKTRPNSSPLSIKTNAEGTAIVRNLSSGPYTLIVSHDDFELAEGNSFGIGHYQLIEINAEEPNGITVVMNPKNRDAPIDTSANLPVSEGDACFGQATRLPKSRPKETFATNAAESELAGVVVDKQGRPLANVDVDAWTWHPGNETKTDAQGRFRLQGLEKQSGVEIKFTKTGYCPSYFPSQKSGSKNWTIVLTQDTYFEGRVLAPDGNPVSDALIRAARGPFSNEHGEIGQVWTETRSDAQGRYRLLVEPYEYDIQVRVPNVGVMRKTGIKIGLLTRICG